MDYGFGHAVDSSLIPRPVLSSSYQRRLGTECDRVLGESPDKLEIAEDDWERGCVDSRLKVPYSGFFINSRGIPDSKSSFPDFKPRDSGFHSKNLMQSGFQEQKFPRHRRGRVESKASHSLFVQSHEREVCHRAP